MGSVRVLGQGYGRRLQIAKGYLNVNDHKKPDETVQGDCVSV